MTADDVGCLCATFRRVQRNSSMETSVHQHGELELYSVGDIEPAEIVVQYRDIDKPLSNFRNELAPRSERKK